MGKLWEEMGEQWWDKGGTIVRVHGWKIGEQWEEQSC